MVCALHHLPVRQIRYAYAPRISTCKQIHNFPDHQRRERCRKGQNRVVSSAQSRETEQKVEGLPEPAQLQEQSWRWDRSDNALQAYTVFFGLLALGQLPVLKTVRFAELPYFIGLASLTIYIGAHRGLTNKMRQQITLRQGALAPLAASAALFGGFLLIKYLPWINLQTVCNAYFWLIGSAAVTGALSGPLRQAAGPFGETSLGIALPEGVLLDESGRSVSRAEIAPSDLLAVAVGLAAASLDFAAGHRNFTFNNLLACLICCDILQLIGLRSFRTAAVLLFGLLAYDVFWVFGSPKVIGENVMLTVATSNILSGPTRLLFPRGAGSVGEAATFPFSLLGLGDIAVPGLLACLALRFDSSKLTLSRSKAGATDAEELTVDRATEEILQQRPYFVTTMAAYVAGLGIAFAANAITHLGQPALLYLVPSCLGGIALTAAVRGDLQRVLKFTDAPSLPIVPELRKEEQK